MTFLHYIGLTVYNKIIKPKNLDEDISRREFILNIILISSLILLFWSGLYLVSSQISDGVLFKGVSIKLFCFIFIFFLFLYVLSRKGYIRLSSYFLISIYFIFTTYASYKWGPDLPTALLSYGLIILVSSILINTGFGFITTGAVAIATILLGYLNNEHIVVPADYWSTKPLYTSDTIEYSVILIIIAVISWLSNREIERSLSRARKSEMALKSQRDLLEVEVNERTKELKQLQMRRMTEMHRMAESGKMATGLFHDLMNPLTALTLAVEQFNTKKSDNKLLAQQVNKALIASRRVGEFITAIQRKSSASETPELLDLRDELTSIITLLQYEARQHKVNLILHADSEVVLLTSPADFYNIVHNLISFGIENSETLTQRSRTVLEINLISTSEVVTVEIIYISTKYPNFVENEQNSTINNLGLLIAKNLLEKLEGELSVSTDQTQQAISLKAQFKPTWPSLYNNIDNPS